MTTVSDYSGPNPPASGSADLTPGEEDHLDKQMTYLAGFALVALIVCIVLLFVFSTSVSGFGPAFQIELVQAANSIQGQVVGASQLFQQGAKTVTYLAVNTFNQTTNTVSDGVTSVLNVVTSVGASAINTILNGITSLVQLLSEMGADTFIFFENIFQPVVSIVSIIGQVIEDAVSILTSFLTPILNTILDLANAIDLIGSTFPWG